MAEEQKKVTYEQLENKIYEGICRALSYDQAASNDLLKKVMQAGCSIGKYVLENKLMNNLKLRPIVEEVMGSPEYDPALMQWSEDGRKSTLRIVPGSFMRAKKMTVKGISKNKLGAIMLNPMDEETIGELQCMSGCRVETFCCNELSLEKCWELNKVPEDDELPFQHIEEGYYFDKIETLVEDAKNFINTAPMALSDDEEFDRVLHSAPVLLLTQEMFHEMMGKGGSDMHFEPFEKEFRLRLRQDGSLRVMWKIPKSLHPFVTARIRLMSDTTPRATILPFDGRIGYNVVHGRKLEFRVSVMPTVNGEKSCLRQIDQEGGVVPLDVMGFRPESLLAFRKAFKSPQGMVLITGPTGSGKTTTLYSVLNELNTEDICIDTAEDPVEGNIYGVAQVYCDPEIGLDFAAALKAFLRQDPDVILIGEVRDRSTGEVAVKAAMTGHLVLATLHTNSAPETINRLVNMEIPPFLIAGGLILVHAQRLIRKICSKCKQEVDAPEQLMKDYEIDPKIFEGHKFYGGKGCDACEGTGMKGRMGLFEVLEVDDAIKENILARSTSFEILETARKRGFLTLREDGFEKVKSGDTTLEEVLKATL